MWRIAEFQRRRASAMGDCRARGGDVQVKGVGADTDAAQRHGRPVGWQAGPHGQPVGVAERLQAQQPLDHTLHIDRRRPQLHKAQPGRDQLLEGAEHATTGRQRDAVQLLDGGADPAVA